MSDFLDFLRIFFDVLWMYSPAAVVGIGIALVLALSAIITSIVHEISFQVARWRYRRRNV